MILYDSLSRKKKEFIPLTKDSIKIYVCGITPNNATHLGHAFTYVSFDALNRFLSYKGMHIQYVQNATDINDGDDVIKQAVEAGKTWEEIAQHWVTHFHRQMDSLNVVRPTKYIMATSVIPQVVSMNQELIDKGFAYVKNGNVYFDIGAFSGYGSLSKFSKSQMLMISQDRGNDPADPNKKNPLDFILWVAKKDEPHWDSPWGKGRPGWHIECSTMVRETLGDQIDIHGGGRDLIFPHHESRDSPVGKV
ncbi:MAG: class I tRNA ligase family protein [Rhodocyclaceae bacterium]|nr:class I tRNA ligase family protein [Rhodocyclaceae bacterium]